MKVYLSVLFILFANLLFAQVPVNIVLSGKVYSWKSGETNLYYTANGEIFNGKNKIKLDSSMNYKFDLSKTCYKKLTSGEIAFALDTTESLFGGCIQKVNISEINKYAKAKGLKTISLKNDISPEQFCSETASKIANQFEQKYVGKYFKSGSVKESLDLQNEMNEFKWMHPLDKDLMDYTIGNWELGQHYNIDLIHIVKGNSKFGTIIFILPITSFAIKEENGSVILSTAQGINYIMKINEYELIDGNGNLYFLTRESIKYDPVKVENSSSGTYSGGSPKQKKIKIEDFQNAEAALEKASNDLVTVKERVKGSYSFTIINGKEKRNYIVGPDNKQRLMLQAIFQRLLQW